MWKSFEKWLTNVGKQQQQIYLQQKHINITDVGALRKKINSGKANAIMGAHN